MSAPLTNVSVKPAKVGNCTCGCCCDCGGRCGCESFCCELECLVRPNFFCGQLLTDADLRAMVEWTRKRLALARYRDGWGVVCGLDVACSSPRGDSQCCGDTNGGPAVYVNPGYAIDCCGNDLVVCELLKVDLGPVCRPPQDPCDPKAKPTPPANPDDRAQDGPRDCFELSRGDLFAVQLNLRYHEDLAQGQRAMFRGGCSDVGPCEYARVLERPCVHLEVVPWKVEPYDEAKDEQQWLDSLRQRLQRHWHQRILPVLQQGPDAVLRYLAHNPPYQLCFLEEVLCCLREQAAPDPNARERALDPELLRVGMYLVWDWLLRELQCPCASCRPDTGVPLSRVLLRRTVTGNRTQCKVLMIDSHVPHRRPLRKDDCRPIPEGRIDLKQFLWQSPAFVQSRFDSLRVKLSQNDNYLQTANAQQFESLMAERQILTFDPAWQPGLIAHVVTDPFGTPRIAAFESARAPNP